MEINWINAHKYKPALEKRCITLSYDYECPLEAYSSEDGTFYFDLGDGSVEKVKAEWYIFSDDLPQPKDWRAKKSLK